MKSPIHWPAISLSADSGRTAMIPRAGRQVSNSWLSLLTALAVLALVCPALADSSRAVSVPYAASKTGAGNSHLPVFSADGQHVAFVSQANNLVTNDDLGPYLDLFVRDLVTSNTVLVSVSTNGFGGANDNIALYSLSSNAQFITFETAASSLAPGDTNHASDVFVRDLMAGTTTLVSVNSDGTGSGNGPSFNPLISADGRYVIFESAASNLVTNDFNGTNDIFIRDLLAGTTELVSVNADGSASPDGPSHSPSISANGLFVAFVSQATNVVTGVTNRLGEVYVRDIGARTSRWAIASQFFATRDPYTGAYSASEPALSVDGRYVAFKTPRGLGVVVRFDLLRTTNRVLQFFPEQTPGSGSNSFLFLDNPRLVIPANGLGNSALALTRDGRYLAFAGGSNGAPSATVLRTDFETFVTNVVHYSGGGSIEDFYVTNQLAQTLIVSTNFAGMSFNTNRASTPAMSADGNRIVFLSDASNEPGVQSDGRVRVYLRDMTTNTIQSISADRLGRSSEVVSDIVPALTPDGTRVAWESFDSNLVPDDLNRASDVFARDVDTGDTQLVSARHPALASATGLSLTSLGPGTLSGDGKRVAMGTLDNILTPDDTNLWSDAVLRDLQTGTNLWLSGSFPVRSGSAGGLSLALPTNSVLPPLLSADGRYAVFAQVLLQPPIWTNITLFWRDLVGGTNWLVASGTGVSHPAVSADGRLVAFQDISSGRSYSDIFLFGSELSLPRPTPVAISLSSSGIAGNGSSVNPVFSPDGSWATFQSLASSLAPDVSGVLTGYQLYARRLLRGPTNTVPGELRLISYSTVASPLASGTSSESFLPGSAGNAAFNADSHYVAFEAGTNLIYRHDLLHDYVLSITNAFPFPVTNRARLTNVLVCTGCSTPSVSADGRFIAYESRPLSGVTNVFVKDLQTGETELLSANLTGTSGGNGPSFTPLLSHDARFVVFASKASDLVVNDTNRATDIFVRDRLNHVTFCISQNALGTAPGNRVSSNPVLSADGRTVAFQSFASDLVPGDYNDTRDVFVVTLAGPDTDGDGMDDDWEMAYFNTLSRDGTGDFDNDGMSDLAEFRAGTDPTNTGSILRVLKLTTAGNQPAPGQRTTVLLWSAVPGRSYRIQFKETVDSVWTYLAGDVTASSTTASATHTTNDMAAARFYRVIVLP